MFRFQLQPAPIAASRVPCHGVLCNFIPSNDAFPTSPPKTMDTTEDKETTSSAFAFVDSENIRIDAMPYIDPYNDPAVKRSVEALVQAEMAASVKPLEEYRKELPPAPELKILDLPIVKAEFERIAAGKPQIPLNLDRYKVEPPPASEQGSVEAWRKAVDNAHAQLQHQTERLVNLELMKKFGPTAWRMHADQVTQIKDSLAHVVAHSREAVQAINRKRKAEQLDAKPLLDSLERQFHELAAKNNEIETVCWALEREVKKLRTLVGEPVDGAAKPDGQAA